MQANCNCFQIIGLWYFLYITLDYTDNMKTEVCFYRVLVQYVSCCFYNNFTAQRFNVKGETEQVTLNES